MLVIAAIAAHEGRAALVMGIGGAFLNADIPNTNIEVHMRLKRSLTSMLVSIDPGHARFVEEQGKYVVELDKVLYGCVEAAALWYDNLSASLTRNILTPTATILVFSTRWVGIKSHCMLTTYL